MPEDTVGPESVNLTISRSEMAIIGNLLSIGNAIVNDIGYSPALDLCVQYARLDLNDDPQIINRIQLRLMELSKAWPDDFNVTVQKVQRSTPAPSFPSPPRGPQFS